MPKQRMMHYRGPRSGKASVRLLVLMIPLLFPPSQVMSQSTPPAELQFVESREISRQKKGPKEPSGLAMNAQGTALWIVSDSTSRAYRLDLLGLMQDRPRLPGDYEDLEGIALDEAGQRVLVVQESGSRVIAFDRMLGSERTNIALTDLAGQDKLASLMSGDDNKDGLEGITHRTDTGHIFVIKERNPRLLIELSSDLGTILNVVQLTAERGFVSDHAKDSKLDVSGLAWDAERRGFWIASDTGQTVFFFDPLQSKASRFDLSQSDTSGAKLVEDAEGVALSPDANSLYVVTDQKKDSRLFIYAIRD